MVKKCPNCGSMISAQNYKRHTSVCDGTGIKAYKRVNINNLHCPFCNNLCKNANSYSQHVCRCKNNPDRKAFDNLTKYVRQNIKGRTAENCIQIAKQAQTIKDKYNNGYISKLKGRKHVFTYSHKKHNDNEIKRWTNWLAESGVEPKELKVQFSIEGYDVVVWNGNRIFNHNYKMSYVLGGLSKDWVVHHIDGKRDNNNIFNLLVFCDKASHKRFHNSNYAYLIYDDNTHLFYCELRT